MKADTTTDQIPGQYTAHVTYREEYNSSKNSMIEDQGMWNKDIHYEVAADGSSNLTIQQEKMMEYMKTVDYIGENTQGSRVPMQKSEVDENNGSWKVHLTPALTAELQAGHKILIKMHYYVPFINFDHDNVGVLVQVNSVDKPDKDTYQQNQKLQQQLIALQAEFKNNPQLNKLQGSFTSLLRQSEDLTESLRTNTNQNNDFSQQVENLGTKIENLQRSVTDLKQEQNSKQNKDRASLANKSPDGNSQTTNAGQDNVGSKNSQQVLYVNSLTTAGTYFAQVDYLNSDTGKPSMIQTNKVWDRNIRLVKNADGTVLVTITQPVMMDYMNSLTFAGTPMQAHKNGTSGYWTATLSAAEAQNLKKGNKLLVSMLYTVPGVFAHGHNVSAYVDINSISVGQKGYINNDDGSSQLPKAPGQDNSNSEQIASTPVGYDTQNGKATSASVPVDGMPVSADPALLPQTGEKEHQDNNELTVGVVMFVVLISGITGFDIYRRKQNA